MFTKKNRYSYHLSSPLTMLHIAAPGTIKGTNPDEKECACN